MNVDLLVVGGGMAGTAAAAAATAGARVLLVEKGDHVGGSAIYAGFAWTRHRRGAARAEPRGDPDLAARLVAGFPGRRRVDPLARRRVPPAVTILRFGRGHQFDTGHYIARCEQRIKERTAPGTRPARRGQTDGAARHGRRRHRRRHALPDGSTRRVTAAGPCSPPADTRPTRTCGPTSSTRRRATWSCAATRGARATACGSAGRRGGGVRRRGAGFYDRASNSELLHTVDSGVPNSGWAAFSPAATPTAARHRPRTRAAATDRT